MSETKWTAGPWRVETTAGLDGLPDHHVFSYGRRIAQVNWQSELPSLEASDTKSNIRFQYLRLYQ